MKKQTFNEFMQEVHSQIFPMVLDDDLPDHYSDWLGTHDVQEMMEYAELYGKSQYLVGKEEILMNK